MGELLKRVREERPTATAMTLRLALDNPLPSTATQRMIHEFAKNLISEFDAARQPAEADMFGNSILEMLQPAMA